MTNKKKNTKTTKKTAIGLLVLGQIMTTGALAAPQEAISAFKDVKEIRQDIGHFKGEIKLFIEKDGKKTRVDQNMKDGLRVVEGRTCVGVRDLVNAIEGAEVEWDQANKIVDIRYGGKEISYPLGKPVMWDGDKMVTIDVPAQVDPSISRTFLPIRNIAETLGFKVDWNQKTKEVTLKPGAGTGQTTTQNNTKPKANTNTENLKWVTASGQKIPKRDELPSEPFHYYTPKKDSSFYIYQSDVTNNPDGTKTYFKGTPLEFTTQPKFKYVKKSPEWGGFNLFGPSGNDPRVGLAAFQEGHPVYDKWKAKQIKIEKDVNVEYGNVGTYSEVDPSFGVEFMPHELFEEYKHRRIDNSLIKQIPARLKMDKNSEEIKSFLKEIQDMDKFHTEWYDYTGVLNAHIIGVTNLPGISNIIFEALGGYLITTDGYLVASSECEKYKDKVIDKVIQTGTSYSYVVDIPDVNIGEWMSKIKYTEGTYGINKRSVNLHK